MSKKTKIKKLALTSVDMVRSGANQEAFINLYKSAGDPAEPNAPSDPPSDAPVAPNSDEIPQGLWKSIMEAVKGFMKTGESQTGEPEPEEVEKAAESFKTRVSQQEIRDNRWRYQDALNMSIDSILGDNDLSDEEKVSMINQSVEQFADAYKEMCAMLLKTTANTVTSKEPAGTVGKSQVNEPEKDEEGEEEMKIDKSKFTPEELVQYEALIAKGLVNDNEPDDNEPKKDEPKKDEPKKDDVDKSAEMHPEVKKALDEMAELRKSLEMKEMTDVAKKYAPLGKKEDELAATLYEMKKSSQESYDAYIAVLDQNLDLVNKSGLFEEIGKSSRGASSSIAKSEPVAKIEGIAKSYMDKDPSLDYNTALAKAWENNPELMDAYDEEY